MRPHLLLAAALLLGAPAARATREPGDYRESVMRFEAQRLEALNAAGRFDQVAAQGERFVDRVGAHPLVLYELGYAYNRMARLDLALDAYDRALDLDGDLAAARYDRGEILLSRGRLDKADADFTAAARLRPEHWAVHYRLAQVAGRKGDGPRMETELVEAVRNGFDFKTLLGDEDWRTFAADPTLGPVLTRMIVVYGDERVLEELRRPQSP